MNEYDFSPAVQKIMDKHYAEQRRAEEELYQRQREAAAPKPPPKNTNISLCCHNGVWTADTGKRGNRMIRGIASTPTVNARNRVMRSSGCEAKFPIPLVCAHHDYGQIGDIVSVQIGPKEVIVEGMIWSTEPADYAWNELIKTGEMRCLSVGSTLIRKAVIDERIFAERWLLREVSIVRTPANPDCRILRITENGRRIDRYRSH